MPFKVPCEINFLHLFSKFHCIEGQISNDSKYQSFNSVISVIKCQDLLVRIPINKTVFKNLKDVFHFVQGLALGITPLKVFCLKYVALPDLSVVQVAHYFRKQINNLNAPIRKNPLIKHLHSKFALKIKKPQGNTQQQQLMDCTCYIHI